ncbi:MAG: uroporphyrinogen-III synthase, partial [Deltaproteobacteria bacterium]|nr:uroporphyrinogen-III synthase [Deltaproteobacteria bacterium]
MSYQGKTILVTRPAKQAGETIAELEQQGANVIHIPFIEIADPSDHYQGLDETLKKLYAYHWIVFTSQNAVTRFFARPLAPSGEELQQRVAAVGPQTAKLLHDLGVADLVVADETTSDALVRSLQSYDWKGKCVLFPRAKEGRDVLVKGLEQQGA